MPRKERRPNEDLVSKVFFKMFDFTLILSSKQVLERLERAKEELEVKDSLLAELYVSHISQRQTIKTEYQVFLYTGLEKTKTFLQKTQNFAKLT